MSKASVTSYIHEPFDINTHFLPQVAFNLMIVLQNISDLGNFFF